MYLQWVGMRSLSQWHIKLTLNISFLTISISKITGGEAMKIFITRSWKLGIMATIITILMFSSYQLPSAQQRKDKGVTKIEIATAPFGGSYYIVGTSIAKVFQEEMKIPCVGSVTEGGGENVRLIDKGSVQAAVIPTSSLWMGRRSWDWRSSRSGRRVRSASRAHRC